MPTSRVIIDRDLAERLKDYAIAATDVIRDIEVDQDVARLQAALASDEPDAEELLGRSIPQLAWEVYCHAWADSCALPDAKACLNAVTQFVKELRAACAADKEQS